MKKAKVMLWGNLVGVVVWNDDYGHGVFEFSKEFLSKGLDIAPIIMPLKNMLQTDKRSFKFSQNELPYETFKGLPGLLADLLPDNFGNKVINNWLNINNKTLADFSPIDRLCYTGSRGMGALEFEPDLKTFKNTVKVNLSDLSSLIADIINIHSSFNTTLNHPKGTREALLDVVRVATSAGGARAKAVIAINDKTKDIVSGQIKAPDGYDYYLIKFDGINKDASLSDPLPYGKIEYVYHKMAIDCGINMSKCRLLQDGDSFHFLTKRFDRLQGGEKLHMQSLCAMGHLDFNNRFSNGYEHAFLIARALNLPYPQTEELFKRMVFNVVARNQDDHTKNISFLMNKSGIWSLSPAYDITYSYDPSNIWTKQHLMSINGKRDEFLMSDFQKIANNFDIKNWKPIIERVTDSVSKFKNLCKEVKIPTKQIENMAASHRLKIPNDIKSTPKFTVRKKRLGL